MIPELSHQQRLPSHRSRAPQDRLGQLRPRSPPSLGELHPGSEGGLLEAAGLELRSAGGGSPGGIEQAAMFQEEPVASLGLPMPAPLHVAAG